MTDEQIKKLLPGAYISVGAGCELLYNAKDEPEPKEIGFYWFIFGDRPIPSWENFETAMKNSKWKKTIVTIMTSDKYKVAHDHKNQSICLKSGKSLYRYRSQQVVFINYSKPIIEKIIQWHHGFIPSFNTWFKWKCTVRDFDPEIVYIMFDSRLLMKAVTQELNQIHGINFFE
jgi:hypothetical protein